MKNRNKIILREHSCSISRPESGKEIIAQEIDGFYYSRDIEGAQDVEEVVGTVCSARSLKCDCKDCV